MKLKKLLKVLRPYQYIRINELKDNKMNFGEIILLKNFSKDIIVMNCKVIVINSNIGYVDGGEADILSIIIDKGGNKID